MKKLSDIENLQEYFEDLEKRHSPYHYNPQIEIMDSKYNADFLNHCEQFSSYTYVDGLGGKGKSGFSRHNIPGKKLQDVIHMAETGIACGIKIVANPIMKVQPYEKWENGYIEGFIRMDADDGETHEWLVWQYIQMEKLDDVINPFRDKLYMQ